MPPSLPGVEGLGLTFSDSWGGGLDMVAVGAWQCLLDGGWAVDMGEHDRTPLRRPYKPSAADPATAISTFRSPSASNHCASTPNELAHCSKCSPWKRRMGSVTKARLSHKTVEEQSERLSNTKQREIPDSITPPPPLLLKLAPPASIHKWAQSTSYSSCVVALASSPSDDSFADETIPNETKGDQAGRFGKQMFWSDGSFFF